MNVWVRSRQWNQISPLVQTASPLNFIKSFGMTLCERHQLLFPERATFRDPEARYNFFFTKERQKSSFPKELEANYSFKLRLQNCIESDRKSNETGKLPEIINNDQSGFLKRRSIAENIYWVAYGQTQSRSLFSLFVFFFFFFFFFPCR